MSTERVPRDELEAALAARQELGPTYEPAIVDSFVDRLEKTIEQRVDTEVARQVGDAQVTAKEQRAAISERSGQALALGIVSIVLSIPLTAITAEKAGVAGLVLVWVGVVLVNLAFNLGGRSHRS